jgi:hypothetical protein
MADSISVDAEQPASLRFPGVTVKFTTVEDAASHWLKLPVGDREHVVLVLETGQVYQPAEIGLLQFVRHTEKKG